MPEARALTLRLLRYPLEIWSEYFRIDPQPYVEEVVTYENYDELKDETSWGMIMHDGMCGLELPVNYVPFTKP